jgi:hypothetical protein
MPEEIVALGLPLSPVSHIVDAHHPDRAGHSDESSEVNAEVLQPQRALEAVVDQPPVHSHGMTCAKCDRTGCDEEGEG